jgi:hypothetical protein
MCAKQIGFNPFTHMNIKADHIHELLDRTHIASQHVQMALGEHPALSLRPEWQALYEAAVDNLETLYQRIGSHFADAANGHNGGIDTPC